MIGSGVVVFPILFANCGLVTSQLTVLVIGLISYKTASLLLLHLKTRENDLTDIIQRSLGNKHNIVFMISAGLTLLLVGIVYFLFMNNILYSLISFFYFQVHNKPSLDKSVFSFSQFSL